MKSKGILFGITSVSAGTITRADDPVATSLRTNDVLEYVRETLVWDSSDSGQDPNCDQYYKDIFNSSLPFGSRAAGLAALEFTCPPSRWHIDYVNKGINAYTPCLRPKPKWYSGWFWSLIGWHDRDSLNWRIGRLPFALIDDSKINVTMGLTSQHIPGPVSNKLFDHGRVDDTKNECHKDGAKVSWSVEPFDPATFGRADIWFSWSGFSKRKFNSYTDLLAAIHRPEFKLSNYDDEKKKVDNAPKLTTKVCIEVASKNLQNQH